MEIEISAAGGFAGIKAAGMHKRIDPDLLAPPLARQLRETFAPEALARIAAAPCRTCPDGMSYRITVTETETRSFTLREGQLPPEMLDLIDRL